MSVGADGVAAAVVADGAELPPQKRQKRLPLAAACSADQHPPLPAPSADVGPAAQDVRDRGHSDRLQAPDGRRLSDLSQVSMVHAWSY